jgi:septal ring factor EnvC (AmiA/AmiB activator)
MTAAARAVGPRRASLPAILLATALPLALGAGSAASYDPAADPHKLDQLRARLATLSTQQQTATDQRGALTRDLKRDEQRVATAAATLREAERDLAEQQRALDALRRDEELQRRTLKRERSTLAAQVRSAYASGREERLKVLLNLEDPSRVGRVLEYYARFNAARGARIAKVDAAVAELTRLGHEVESKVAVLNGVRKARAGALDELQQARDARRQALAALEKEIKQRGGELARVTREAERLRRLLDSIGDVFADAPFDGAATPFPKQKGRLPWPLKGRLLASYGQPRAEGKLKWEGLLIESQAGAPVRAIAAGRIAYADWLPFYGMLVIVEHGDGYMSLYGHNQAIEKQAGEWVQRGDTLALSGDSGGQNRAALYFELRKGKEPQDPRRWLARR